MRLVQAKDIVVTAFRRRWEDLYSTSIAERRSITENCYDGFEAVTIHDCLSLAQQYYGIDHIYEMCNLPKKQVMQNLAPVCRYLQKTYPSYKNRNEPAYKDALGEAELILSSEYIMLTRDGLSYDDDPSEDDFAYDIAPYSMGGNDDWYERVGGFKNSFSCLLMKSTGEDFTERETTLLNEAITHNLKSNGEKSITVNASPIYRDNIAFIEYTTADYET